MFALTVLVSSHKRPNARLSPEFVIKSTKYLETLVLELLTRIGRDVLEEEHFDVRERVLEVAVRGHGLLHKAEAVQGKHW